MGILNIDIESTTNQTKRNIMLYNIVGIIDAYGARKCIVLDVDNNGDPSLVGMILSDGYKYVWQGYAIMDSNNSRLHYIGQRLQETDILNKYYSAGWKLPGKEWFEGKFGVTYKDRWEAPMYDKFRNNILDLMDVGVDHRSSYYLWTSSKEYNDIIKNIQPVAFNISDTFFNLRNDLRAGINRNEICELRNATPVEPALAYYTMLVREIGKGVKIICKY